MTIPPRIPPDAYERLAALREACRKVKAARDVGDELGEVAALEAAEAHWRELVKLHHPEHDTCRASPVNSG